MTFDLADVLAGRDKTGFNFNLAIVGAADIVYKPYDPWKMKDIHPLRKMLTQPNWLSFRASSEKDTAVFVPLFVGRGKC